MRNPISTLVVLLLFTGAVPGLLSANEPGDPKREIAAALDDFHDAASKADGTRYFDHFAPEAVFLGTDSTERWTLEEFRAFARPYFDQGKGWTYVPKERHITLGPANTAWFDELLENESYGTCRGSGVLVRVDGAWKIAQYNLSIPIPNDLAKQVVTMIRRSE